MAAEPLPDASVADLPADALPADEVAVRLGRSRRSLTRWSSSHPEELPKYTQTAADGSARVLFSWADVVAFCVSRQKSLPPGTLTYKPDDSLSDALAAPVGHGVGHDGGGAIVSDSPGVVSDAVTDSPGVVSDTVSDSPRQETISLQAKVSRLSAQLQAAEDALQTARASHHREIALMEARLAEMVARIGDLQVAHSREIEGLREELVARRGEASEARAAAEAQRQREAALRWQTAAMKGERDQALAELVSWSGAGWLRRMLSKPRIPEAQDPGKAEDLYLLEVLPKP